MAFENNVADTEEQFTPSSPNPVLKLKLFERASLAAGSLMMGIGGSAAILPVLVEDTHSINADFFVPIDLGLEALAVAASVSAGRAALTGRIPRWLSSGPREN